MSEILNVIDVNNYGIQKMKSEGGSEVNLQSKEVTITQNGTTTVTADTGYDGLSEVEVEVNVPMPSGSYPPDWSEIGYEEAPQALLDDFAYSKEIYDNWDSSQTSMYLKFNNNKNLIYMPVVDTSNVTDMMQMFNGCSNLVKIPLLDLSKVNRTLSMFYNCEKIVEVPLFDLSSVDNAQGMFGNCYNLKTLPVFI